MIYLDSRSSSSVKTCGSCHRSFTYGTDVNSIRWRNMCENRNKNYKYSQELKEEIRNYNERY